MKRIPPWVVIVAFAALAGGAIALVALRRGKDHAAYCGSRLPELPAYTRTTDGNACRTTYAKDGKTVLVVVRRRDDFGSVRDALARELQLPAEPLAQHEALFETTVQATAAKRVGLVGTDGDLTILHFDPAIFDREQALAIMRAL